MKCTKCPVTKEMPKTRVEFYKFDGKMIKSKTYKPMYLCTNCGATYDIDIVDRVMKCSFTIENKDLYDIDY